MGLDPAVKVGQEDEKTLKVKSGGAIDVESGGKILDDGVQASAIVSLTDSSGGTAGDTIADVPATYTEATLANQLASLTAKINGILAALRGAGIIAP